MLQRRFAKLILPSCNVRDGAAANDWASAGLPNSILLNKSFAQAQLVYGGVPAPQHRLAELTARKEQGPAPVMKGYQASLEKLRKDIA
jgi:hypothetical protein